MAGQTTLSSTAAPVTTSGTSGGRVAAGIIGLSIIYFADIFLRASRKCFWFDELFVVYLCRLPTMKLTWAAVKHGADFNPPLVYLLTRGAQRLFGEGLIATRLPAILGVWIFCLCLFFFVARRAGALAGLIAGTFPFFTLAQYYAYEARSHGIVLGFAGLALICWQRIEDGQKKYLWLMGFGLCLVGALLTHVYAVYLLFPFALAELYWVIRRRRPDWGIVSVMAVAFLSVTVAVYLPLFRSYRIYMPKSFWAPAHDVLQRYLMNMLGPAIMLLMLSLVLLVIDGMRGSEAIRLAVIPQRELVAAIGFACIPVIGLIGCKVSHGPFIDRYFISGLAGYSIFYGYAASRRQVNAVSPRVLAAFMVLLMMGDLAVTSYYTAKNRIALVEPSSGVRLSTTPAEPLQLFGTFANPKPNLDILAFPVFDYFYLYYYLPPSVSSRLYYAASSDDFYLGAYERLQRNADVKLHLTTVEQFTANRSHFLLYESGHDADLMQAQTIARAGFRLVSIYSDSSGVMFEYEK